MRQSAVLIFCLPLICAGFRFPESSPRNSRAVLFRSNEDEIPSLRLNNPLNDDSDRWAWPSSSASPDKVPALPVVSVAPQVSPARPPAVPVVPVVPAPLQTSPVTTEQRQSRQNANKNVLVTKKSVAKPYRVLTKVSSCPKLYHDLNVTCGLPNDRQSAIFQWRKTIYGSPQHQVSPFEQEVKIAVAHGSSLLVRESRYSVRVTPSSSTLSIRQLKVSDCGLFTCEALHSNGTLMAAADVMVYLCF